MAKQKSSGGVLAAKLGSRLAKAHEAHKDDVTAVSAGAGLPSGIELGIARLKSIQFGTYKTGKMQGEVFFMAQGTVLEPKKHDGIQIEGLNTQIGPEPLCDTPERKRATFDDHYAWVLNQLRLLGLDTSEIDGSELEEVCEVLVGEAPTFRFRTWGGGEYTDAAGATRQGSINHEWNGAVDHDPEDSDDVEEDDVVEEVPKGKKKTSPKPKPEPEEEEEEVTEEEATEEEGEEEEVTEEEGEEEDLQALGAAADDGDEDAQVRLTELAEEAEFDTDTVETWTEVASALRGVTEEEATEEEEWSPEVGEVYLYMPPKSKKAVECSVTKVLAKSQKVSLKAKVGGKVYVSVPWSEIEPE